MTIQVRTPRCHDALAFCCPSNRPAQNLVILRDVNATPAGCSIAESSRYRRVRQVCGDDWHYHAHVYRRRIFYLSQ